MVCSQLGPSFCSGRVSHWSSCFGCVSGDDDDDDDLVTLSFWGSYFMSTAAFVDINEFQTTVFMRYILEQILKFFIIIFFIWRDFKSLIQSIQCSWTIFSFTGSIFNAVCFQFKPLKLKCWFAHCLACWPWWSSFKSLGFWTWYFFNIICWTLALKIFCCHKILKLYKIIKQKI